MTDETRALPTSADIEAIRQRADAATPGPWVADRGQYNDLHFGNCGAAAGVVMPEACGFFVPGFKPEDADFIAHARTDVPVLLAALDEERRVQADRERELEEARNLLRGWVAVVEGPARHSQPYHETVAFLARQDEPTP